jgi:hypothetical protein
MRLQCPECLSPRIRPVDYRWYEGLLALLLVRPYCCRRCGDRFLGFAWPGLPLGLHLWQRAA